MARMAVSSVAQEVLQGVANVWLGLVAMMMVDRLYMYGVVGLVRLFGMKPQQRFKFLPVAAEDAQTQDVELGSRSLYPKVLVQIPMCNELEVYKLSIGATCMLSWPLDRLILQVLDDSTDPSIKEEVRLECQLWANKGIHVKYETRRTRGGYKAGALKDGMEHSYVKECEYVAIFDADFQPEPDFLLRTIPFFVHNPQIALVQARWTFVNANECLLTTMQEMTLRYHFLVEQEYGSAMHSFFGFNGTAGIWRISAMDEAGGWKDRTTVEDLDLSMRVSLRGWKFVYLNDVKVKSELPSTYRAFRNQQHRWSCGPANLFRKILPDIIQCKKVGFWRKLHVVYAFFVVRKFVVPVASFGFFCVIIPMTAIFPAVYLPKWALVYIPTILTVLNAICNHRSMYLIFFSNCFETVMALHRLKATVIGFFNLKGVNEWIVTEKSGDPTKPGGVTTSTRSKSGRSNALQLSVSVRAHIHELLVGAYMLVCGAYELMYGRPRFYCFLFIQGAAFLIMGIGYIGSPGT